MNKIVTLNETVTANLVVVPPSAVLEAIMKTTTPIEVSFHVQPVEGEENFFNQSNPEKKGPQCITALVYNGRRLKDGSLVIKGYFGQKEHKSIPFTVVIDAERKNATMTRQCKPEVAVAQQQYASQCAAE